VKCVVGVVEQEDVSNLRQNYGTLNLRTDERDKNKRLSVSRLECGTAEYVNEYNLYFHKNYPIHIDPSS